jgi:hypothetical protein
MTVRKAATKKASVVRKNVLSKGAASGAISDRWRYLAVKRGSAIYLTEVSPGQSGTGKRLFRVPGRRVVFERGSTVPQKVHKAFASAVKTAP